MEYILLTAFGGAQPNISDKELLDCSAPVPPCDEQHAIAEYLNAKTAKIDRLSAEVETASDRLRDYRTALISAAVTGKIDVRGGAA
jgi:restriction endonuclease S subunit